MKEMYLVQWDVEVSYLHGKMKKACMQKRGKYEKTMDKVAGNYLGGQYAGGLRQSAGRRGAVDGRKRDGRKRDGRKRDGRQRDGRKRDSRKRDDRQRDCADAGRRWRNGAAADANSRGPGLEPRG